MRRYVTQLGFGPDPARAGNAHAAAVNKALEEGFELVGGVSVTVTESKDGTMMFVYAQAMLSPPKLNG